MYHYVRPVPDAEFPYLKVCSWERFVRQLDYLQGNYRMVSWPDAAAHIERGAPLPARACLLTFDDGLRDGYAYAFPELKRRGISGLFFPMARHPDEGLASVQTLQLLANKFSEPVEFEEILFAKMPQQERDRFAASLVRERAEYPPDRYGENHLRSMRRVLNTYMFREIAPVLDEICRERIADPKTLGAAFYLADVQIREMASAGMYFGGHGVSHHRMTRLTPRNWSGKSPHRMSFCRPTAPARCHSAIRTAITIRP